MAEQQCGKCGEMVDEAKAFCPGCGHSFVDEKQRETVSDFDQSKRTVQLGETMFNQMLSEMGLNISKPPNREEKKSELVVPLAPPATDPSAEQKTQPSPTAVPPKRNSKTFWIIVIVLAALAFAIVVMLITVACLIYFYR